MSIALIALGSNLGDRDTHIASAIHALAGLDQSRLMLVSSVYETAPVGPEGQGAYLNAAAVLDTLHAPHALLRLLREIERQAGRERREKWGPRTLDLDLLLYDDRVIETEDLTVPHPHMHERRFVLEPLAEVAADSVHPKMRKTVAELLAALVADEGK